MGKVCKKPVVKLTFSYLPKTPINERDLSAIKIKASAKFQEKRCKCE